MSAPRGTASSGNDVTDWAVLRVNSTDSGTRSHHCLQSPGKAQSGWLALHPNPSPSLKTFLHDSEKLQVPTPDPVPLTLTRTTWVT